MAKAKHKIPCGGRGDYPRCYAVCNGNDCTCRPESTSDLMSKIAARDAIMCEQTDQIATLRADLAASQREVERLRQQVTIIDDGIGEAKAEVERCRGIITDLCGLHCTGGAADFDSERLGPNNDALRYLAEIGRVEIVSEQGRRVVARWIP